MNETYVPEPEFEEQVNNEYIKIDPNTDVTWENLGDILCEHTTAMIINRKQGTPQ